MKTSSARRVHFVLNEALNFAPQRGVNTALGAWAKIFKLVAFDFEGQISPDVEYAVLDNLRDLRAEVVIVERQVEESEAKSATTPIAETVRILTGTNQLHSDWPSVKNNYLKPELVAGWNWAAIHLAYTDSEYDPKEVESLRADLEALEASARSPGLPRELRMLIDKQVRQIRSALRRYNISGPEPLREAANAVIGEALKEHALIVNAEASGSPVVHEAVGRLRKVWKGVVEVAGDLEKLSKAVEVAGNVAKALPFIS